MIHGPSAIAQLPAVVLSPSVTFGPPVLPIHGNRHTCRDGLFDDRGCLVGGNRDDIAALVFPEENRDRHRLSGAETVHRYPEAIAISATARASPPDEQS